MKRIQRSLLSLILLVLALLVITSLALAAFGSNHLNISKAVQDAGYPAIAVSENGLNIGFVWADRYSGGTATQGPIYFKAASDGQEINKRFTVDPAFSENDQSLTPDIAADPNTQTNMHVVWANLAKPGGTGTDQFYTIYYTRCPTNGSACVDEATVQQVNQTDNNRAVFDPKVATSNNGGNTIVHVVWQFVDTATGKRVIYYSARKADSSWTTPAPVSVDTEFASHPAIATSPSGHVHVAWASDTDKADDDNERIKYCRRPVDGDGVVTSWGSCAYQSWSINDVAGTSDGDHPDYPAVAAAGNTVMVLWDELKGSPWPVNELYYMGYRLSQDSGNSFTGTAHMYPGDLAHPSDHDPSDSTPDVQGSAHARRLQIKATAVTSTTAGVDAVIHAVWHETTSGSPNRHDVQYDFFQDGICGDCGSWPGWNPETYNNKFGSSPNAPYYSMSPDIASANGELYGFYMEGKEDGGYDVNDAFVFDVIYNGTVALTDTTKTNPTDGGTYLPIIMKN
jgi:hypothetical protein